MVSILAGSYQVVLKTLGVLVTLLNDEKEWTDYRDPLGGSRNICSGNI